MFCVYYLASNIFTLSRVYARVYALVIESFITDKVGRCTILNKNNNQKIVAKKKMEAEKHSRCKQRINLHKAFHTYLKRKKSRN